MEQSFLSELIALFLWLAGILLLFSTIFFLLLLVCLKDQYNSDPKGFYVRYRFINIKDVGKVVGVEKDYLIVRFKKGGTHRVSREFCKPLLFKRDDI